MKRIKVQFTATLLIAVIFLSSVLVPAKPAYAIAGFDDAAFILAMLAAAGAGYIGYSSYNSGNSNLAEDLWGELDDLEDDVSDAFDKAVFKVLEGGGGGSDPNDFDPDNDDPEEKPTTWAKLKEWWKKHPNKALSLATSGSMVGYIMNQFGENLVNDSVYFGDLVISDYSKSIFFQYLSDYPKYVICYNSNSLVVDYILMYRDFFFYYNNPHYPTPTFTEVLGGSKYVSIDNKGSNFRLGDGNSGYAVRLKDSSYTPKKFVYDTYDEGYKNRYNTAQYASNLNPDSVLKTDAKKKAEEEEEEKPAYDNVVLPTPEQMQNYANKLDAIAQSDAEPAIKKEQQQQAMNTFVESITNVKEMPNPDPSPDPNPSPNPDPSPDPDPSPEPEPSPEPDPDAPATDEEAAKYTADLTTVFPFCIPFDLIRAFKVLSAEGEAPVYKMPLKIDYKSIHVSEAWQIDMSDFASVIQILRVMETLGFIVGLILVTRKLIRG